MLLPQNANSLRSLGNQRFTRCMTCFSRSGGRGNRHISPRLWPGGRVRKQTCDSDPVIASRVDVWSRSFDCLRISSGMATSKAITVDWNKEGATDAVLPNSPWLSSSPLGWQGIQVQLHRQPAWDCPEHTFRQHVISLHHFPEPTKSQRSFAGRKRTEFLTEGNIVIMPANVPHKDLWDKAGAFTLLILDPVRVAEVAGHSVDPQGVEILPRFAMWDGLIQQIATALES